MSNPYFDQAVSEREIVRLTIERNSHEQATKEVLRVFAALIIQLGGIVNINKAELLKVGAATLERCPSPQGEEFICFRAFRTQTAEEAAAERKVIEQIAAPLPAANDPADVPTGLETPA